MVDFLTKVRSQRITVVVIRFSSDHDNGCFCVVLLSKENNFQFAADNFLSAAKSQSSVNWKVDTAQIMYTIVYKSWGKTGQKIKAGGHDRGVDRGPRI